MWLLANMMQTGMFLAGMVLLIVILLRRTFRHYGRRRSAKRNAEPPLARTPRPSAKSTTLSNAPPDVLGWQVEMHEIAREMKAELDTKMRALQVLIAQARHEADRLEQILTRFESVGERPLDELPETRRSESRSSWLPGSPDRQAEIFALADQGHSAADIAAQVGTPLGEVELILSLR